MSPTNPQARQAQGNVEQPQPSALSAATDFSKPTHDRSRARFVEAGDVEGLKAIKINPASTSPKAMARYRDHRHRGASQVTGIAILSVSGLSSFAKIETKSVGASMDQFGSCRIAMLVQILPDNLIP
jgi:hypothetical protein